MKTTVARLFHFSIFCAGFSFTPARIKLSLIQLLIIVNCIVGHKSVIINLFYLLDLAVGAPDRGNPDTNASDL